MTSHRFKAAACSVMAASFVVAGCAAVVARPSVQSAQSVPAAPEAASGWTDKPGWRASQWMVAAANPLAADAGHDILAAGGSALDAAIAVQMVLTLVEPQSSGIGGGAFLMHWDGQRVQAFDGRETAPAAALDNLFLRDGRPLPQADAVAGGRSVGVPGVLRMLEAAHRQHGTLPWNALFEPAIRLAERGFAISPRLATMLAKERRLIQDAQARAYFYNADGTPKAAGTVLKNPALAAVLREIAARGADALHTGAIARDIAAKVRSHATHPGMLAEQDLADYRPKEREPLCFAYRTVRICGMPAPSSGTIALAQILGMLETAPAARAFPTLVPKRESDGRWSVPAQAVHLYSEAARLAYADRAAYVADADFVDVPTAGLLDRDYLRQRAALIGETSMGTAQAGVPPGVAAAQADDHSPERPSTSHVSVVDARGNAVSMTTTIEDAFGSRQMVHGFLLNNQLTDFSLAPRDAAGRLVANRLQPGKRPRSSMAPLLVFDGASGQLRMTLGSPGGSAIINYVGKVLVGTLDWGLDVQDAISLPNFGSRNGPTELEAGRAGPTLADALTARGHSVRLIEQTSGAQAIARTDGGWFAGADPRREGVARGR
jgi:gamma-glutamyltranspeptidase / glutathione hydrolase